jgi:hypothetical protein
MALALFAAPGIVPGQDPPAPPAVPPKTTPAETIFSGTVTDLGSDSVTVLRTALIGQSVKRTFLLDAQTVVEGKLRAKARVTVRYMADEDGQLHALHIIVR